MDEAEQIIQQLRDAGFKIHAITGSGHWFLFAYKGNAETSVRGDDYLRVVRALAVALGFPCDTLRPAVSERPSPPPPDARFPAADCV